MKLFLSSTSILPVHFLRFLELLGKDSKEINFALIENAADPYPQSMDSFVMETRKHLISLGMNLELMDLRGFLDSSEKLALALNKFDVVWCGGGNTFYLRWLMNATGFDAEIRKFLDQGKVYGGGSAGAVVACPSLASIELVDSMEFAPEILHVGLGLTELSVLPHWGEPSIEKALSRIKTEWEERGAKVVPITDAQAVIICGDTWEILG
jgi:dipeptidase E